MAKISVIMSVYNAEKFLCESMNSIINQSFRDFELIVIDDCSTDKSGQILEEFAGQDDRIKLIKKEQNKGFTGFVENLNTGIQHACGKYIARMDADDISHPERFEKQYNFLEKNPAIFMVGAQANFIDEAGKKTGSIEAPLTHEEIRRRMPKHISMFHPLIMFRNEKISYREKMYFCEDYDLYFRLLCEGKKLANLPDYLLDYRILNSSISRKNNHFVRKIFVEKARQFYQQQCSTSKDEYDNFNPTEIFHILEENYPNSSQDLLFAIGTALKFDDKDSVNKLITKAKLHNIKIPTTIQFFAKIPNKFYKVFSKISSS